MNRVADIKVTAVWLKWAHHDKILARPRIRWSDNPEKDVKSLWEIGDFTALYPIILWNK